MARLPFDPGRARGAEQAESVRSEGGGAGGDVFSPSQMAERIKDVLASGFGGAMRVRGEVSNLRDRNHWYFDLKDADAVVACVAWASKAKSFPAGVKDGGEVLVTGRVDFYGPQGKLQLYVDKVELVGAGALEEQLRKRAAELRALGYFEDARKRALPLLPGKVAVVTSRSAAALQDVIDTAHRRWAGVELMLVDVRVQGDEAAPQVSRALRWLSQHGPGLGIEAVIVTRGGGSIEDLWAFNERVVCDAVVQCALPVVAAIGHETDVTLAELCADLRAATPTQAATRVVPEAEVMREQLVQLQHRLRLAMSRRVSAQQARLAAAERHPLLRRPERLVQERVAKVEALRQRLTRVLPNRMERESERLGSLGLSMRWAIRGRLEQAKIELIGHGKRLYAVSPRSVLARGYSMTIDANGSVVRSAGNVAAGDRLLTQFVDGQVRSTVDGAKPKTKPKTKRKPAAKPDEAAPGDTLFGGAG